MVESQEIQDITLKFIPPSLHHSPLRHALMAFLTMSSAVGCTRSSRRFLPIASAESMPVALAVALFHPVTTPSSSRAMMGAAADSMMFARLSEAAVSWRSRWKEGREDQEREREREARKGLKRKGREVIDQEGHE